MENKEENRSLTKEEFLSKIESFSSFFKAFGEDIRKWSVLPHNLTGLDLLLKHNLVDLRFKTGPQKTRSAICSSNLEFVKKVCAIDLKSNMKRLKTKTGKNPFENPPGRNYIVAWNFLRKNFLAISSDEWEIKGIVEIKESNAETLNMLVEKILKNS